VGGASLRGPAVDLAIAVAVASASSNVPVPKGTVAIGEVGLAGELRRVPSISQRLNEAARLGFTHAIVPSNGAAAPAALPRIQGMTLVECPNLHAALMALKLVGRQAAHEHTDLHIV
ncbi:MAG: magnesium chelatase domain-containing protein, partial [Nocardioidaceae bacterium]